MRRPQICFGSAGLGGASLSFPHSNVDDRFCSLMPSVSSLLLFGAARQLHYEDLVYASSIKVDDLKTITAERHRFA
jgi:hypothetical protein